MPQQKLIQHISNTFKDDARVIALFLSGSFGSGSADAYSDVDFVIVADPETHAGVADSWRATLDAAYKIVHWNRKDGRAILLNAITNAWLRCDVIITSEKEFAGRSQASLQVLIDRAELYDQLPAGPLHAQPKPEYAAWLISEFLRVLGLAGVSMGREEYLLGVTGIGLLRTHLIALMLEASEVSTRVGALHLNRLLTIEQRQTLEALPTPTASRDSLIAADIAYARAFFPIAKALSAKLHIPWPHEFETATRGYLKKELGIEI